MVMLAAIRPPKQLYPELPDFDHTAISCDMYVSREDNNGDEEEHCEELRCKLSPDVIHFDVQKKKAKKTFELINCSVEMLTVKVVLDVNGLDGVFSLSHPMTKCLTMSFTHNLKAWESYSGRITFFPYEEYDECKGTLKVYDYTTGCLLTKGQVLGKVEQYRLCVMQDIVLIETTLGVTKSVPVKFRNIGNKASSIKLRVKQPFTVEPTFISCLAADEEGSCTVSYDPTALGVVEGTLTVAFGDYSDVFKEVSIQGRAASLYSELTCKKGPLDTILVNNMEKNIMLPKKVSFPVGLKDNNPKWRFDVKSLEIKQSPNAEFEIVNSTKKELLFDIPLKQDILTTSPVHGSIKPGNRAKIIVNIVKFQDSDILVTAKQEGPFKPTKSSRTLPITCIIEVVKFDTTPVSASDVCEFVVDNKVSVSDRMMWKLSPDGPANLTEKQMKCSPFQVKQKQGVVSPRTNQGIRLKFSPQEPGLYTQKWTLTYRMDSYQDVLVERSRHLIFEGCTTNPTTSTNLYTPLPNMDKLFLKTKKIEFTVSQKGTQAQVGHFEIVNPSRVEQRLKFATPDAPFCVRYKEMLIGPRQIKLIPVTFKSEECGTFRDVLLITTPEELIMKLPLCGIVEM